MIDPDACPSCGRRIARPPASLPGPADDAAWTRLAAEHAPECEWISTRAFQRSPSHGVA